MPTFFFGDEWVFYFFYLFFLSIHEAALMSGIRDPDLKVGLDVFLSASQGNLTTLLAQTCGCLLKFFI